MLCNKGDTTNPKVRTRCVATEVNKEADLACYALTPPLEATRMLLSKLSNMKAKGCSDITPSFLDIKKA